MDEETSNTASIFLCPHCRAIVPEEYIHDHHMFHEAISELAKAVKVLWAEYKARNN